MPYFTLNFFQKGFKFKILPCEKYLFEFFMKFKLFLSLKKIQCVFYFKERTNDECEFQARFGKIWRGFGCGGFGKFSFKCKFKQKFASKFSKRKFQRKFSCICKFCSFFYDDAHACVLVFSFPKNSS